MTSSDDLQWENAHDGRLAPHAVSIGELSDGRSVWVVRSEEDREMAIGHIISGDSTATIPYFGKALRRKNYQVLTNPGDVQFAWIAATNGRLVDAAVKGGTGPKGQNDPMYIARVQIKGDILPAKLLPWTKRVFAAFNGREVPRREYEVLTITSAPRQFDTDFNNTPAPHGLHWHTLTSATRPNIRDLRKAIPVFEQPTKEETARTSSPEKQRPNHHQPLQQKYHAFVARASLPREITPGTWTYGQTHAILPYFGYARKARTFQILVQTSDDVRIFWVPSSTDDIPDDALLGGKDENGHPMYVARAKIGDHYVSGKAVPAFAKAFFVDGEDEVSRDEFEILCLHAVSGPPEISESQEGIRSGTASTDGGTSADEMAIPLGNADSTGHIDRPSSGFVKAGSAEEFGAFDLNRSNSSKSTSREASAEIMLALQDENAPLLLVSTDFSGYGEQLRIQEHERRRVGGRLAVVAIVMVLVAALLAGWAIVALWRR